MNAQDLKNSILQLAIQGKLVEQRDEEGTAEELYQQIQEEKKRLNEEGKIKKPTKLLHITEDEIPFGIPDSWKWVRLNDILNFIDYRGKTPNKIDSGVVLITASNIRKGFLDFSKEDFISETEYNERMSRGVTQRGDILFTTEAPLGNVAINTIKVASCGQRVITFQQYGEKRFYNELICYFIQSPLFQLELLNNATGTTAKGIKAAKLKNILVPLPPLEEQKRIVAKIEELIPYVDKYHVAYSEVEELNKKFPEDMQKSILQYAIQGKLVEQREEEGTAEELYQQIQGEKQKLIKEGKIKKPKALPEITEGEIPFDIPENWKWVRLGNVIELLSGQDFPPRKYNDMNKGIPYITGASSLSDMGVIVNRWTEEPRCIANSGDVLLVCKGSGYGKTVVCDVEEAHIARQIMSIKYSEFLNMVYLKYFLSANHALIKTWGQGVIPGIDRKSVQNMLFPLPPLKEQKRIVAKIEELLPHCARLEK